MNKIKKFLYKTFNLDRELIVCIKRLVRDNFKYMYYSSIDEGYAYACFKINVNDKKEVVLTYDFDNIKCDFDDEFKVVISKKDGDIKILVTHKNLTMEVYCEIWSTIIEISFGNSSFLSQEEIHQSKDWSWYPSLQKMHEILKWIEQDIKRSKKQVLQDKLAVFDGNAKCYSKRH